MASNRRTTEKYLQDILQADLPIVPEKLEASDCRCGGLGMVESFDGAGNRIMRDCSCRISARIAKRLQRAGLPERYQDTTLDGYQAMGGHGSLARGLAVARRFVQEYPIGTAGKGVLFVGDYGVGKTHLAVGMLRAAVLERGASGLFCDFRELFGRIKDSFSGRGSSEAEILAPVFSADVLVLDDLGAVRVTEWTYDVVENIINGRYNRNKTTIITTNLANLPPGGSASSAEGCDVYAAAARSAMRQETLGDRIGGRMHSRLQQMCVVVEMNGEDYRTKKGK